MLVYADNANHLGTIREQLDVEQDRMRDALRGRGLDTHDAQEASSLCESLATNRFSTELVQPVRAASRTTLQKTLEKCAYGTSPRKTVQATAYTE